MAKKGASRSGGTGARLKSKNQAMAARIRGVVRPGSTATLPVIEARMRHAKPANFDWSRWETPW